VTTEYPDSTVAYGELPQDDTWVAGDPLFVLTHAVTLTELTAGSDYYYRVRSTDQSGNTYVSPEQPFVVEFTRFLPLVLKQ
jgi:hypothetical protein